MCYGWCGRDLTRVVLLLFLLLLMDIPLMAFEPLIILHLDVLVLLYELVPRRCELNSSCTRMAAAYCSVVL